jgi:hypothetical protein
MLEKHQMSVLNKDYFCPTAKFKVLIENTNSRILIMGWSSVAPLPSVSIFEFPPGTF